MIKKIYFRFKRIILNILLKRFTSVYRPSSEPYISGDTFRKFSDHIYDESKKFFPKRVKTNDIIFVKTELLSSFFKNVNPYIESRYILISHNSDNEISSLEIKHMDKKIIHWFAQNLNVKKGKDFSPLPIGIENLRYQTNGVLKDFNIQIPKQKKYYIASSFNVVTNEKIRKNVNSVLLGNNNIINISASNHKEYILTLRDYMFNLCPEGNGYDTHRIWESLLLRTIPIMVKNEFTQNLATLNFPILLLNNWEDLNRISKTELKEIYINESKMKNFTDVVTFNYWKKTINSKKISNS